VPSKGVRTLNYIEETAQKHASLGQQEYILKSSTTTLKDKTSEDEFELEGGNKNSYKNLQTLMN